MPNPNYSMPAELQQMNTETSANGGVDTSESAATTAGQPTQPTPAVTPNPDALGDPGKAALVAERENAAKAKTAAAKATERATAAEQKFTGLTEAIAQALGIKPEQASPEQLTSQLAEANTAKEAAAAENAALRLQLAVLTKSPPGIDAAALVDSAGFTAALKATDPATLDGDGLAKFIATYVAAHPRFKVGAATGADLHAGHGRQPVNVAPGVPRLAAAFDEQFNNRT